MSMKCADCGNIFYECEAGVELEYHSEVPGGAYERFMVCPCCGSDNIGDAVRCRSCKGEFLSDELFAGYYCEECLKEALTIDSFLEFATDGTNIPTEIDTLEDFIFVKVFGLPKSPAVSSLPLKSWCRVIYAGVDKAVLMPAIVDYMDALPSLWDDFAEWIYGREVSE